MLTLKKGADWGEKLMVRLPCGHEVEILREHVNAQGVYVGRLECTGLVTFMDRHTAACGRIYELVRLEGWNR